MLLIHSYNHYSIQHIGFKGSGGLKYNNWGRYPDKFGNIVEAISKCSLAKSLQSIEIESCGINNETAKELLEEHGLGHIECQGGGGKISEE